MNTRMNPMIAAAQRNLQQGRQGGIPRGAQYAAIAGQVPQMQMQQQQQQMQRQGNAPAGMRLSPQMQARMAQGQGQGLAVPQGANAANLAGCDNGQCMTSPYEQPFAGYPQYGGVGVQTAALIGVTASFATDAGADGTLTAEISCAARLFNGCGARAFNGPFEVSLISGVSGFDDRNLFCTPIDLNYFNTNGNGCYCEFDWGCFSQLAPLILTFAVIGTPSTPPLVNLVIAGQSLSGGDACSFWPGMYPGFGGGGLGVGPGMISPTM